jgi:hypothetical protein
MATRSVKGKRGEEKGGHEELTLNFLVGGRDLAAGVDLVERTGPGDIEVSVDDHVGG